MNRDFWNGKRVVVTGHTGFKGSWLCAWLQMLGADVLGYALAPHTEPSMFKATNLENGMASVLSDVRDADRLNEAVAHHRPEIVIHMAAQALVRESYADPVTTYTTNVIGTLNVLEAVRRTPSVRSVVLVTTDKCYENLEWVWGYRENDRMGGHDPYSSSKGCTELLIAAYRNSYFNATNYAEHGVSIASARAGNVIGGGDWSQDRLVPDTIRAIQRGEPVMIRRPGAVRPWLFVLEPLRGYLDLAEKLYESGPDYAGAWNFGPNIEEVKPVSWLVDRLTTLWGDDASWEIDAGDHPHEAHCLKLDCTKAKSLLNWHPHLSIDRLMDWVVEWYQSAERNADVRELTEEQITRYENLR